MLTVIKLSNIPKLDKHIAESLEGNVSEKEILSALKNIKNNKTPASHGFTDEFFKFFWNDIKSYMVSAIQCIFEDKELPISQRSCLPKGDNPRQFKKKWRPISLLNVHVFYKFISSCISFEKGLP